MKIKVGSLFDGIGGTPLATIMSGAEPVWASEIEKIPVSITERHFPNMTHYGDVTQINGAEIEPVDLIVGGSPCQDLSVAGKRAGLEGERSGLFMDQVRIVKEMRNATRRETGDGTDELPRPRYMVWENVPGALSSNKGEDFRAVLEEVCRIGEEEVSIPRPPKGKWFKAGTILGDGYSVAWRTVDAQHWGVPQRRRRIYLVADFGGHTAPEICFEREGVSGDLETSGEARKGAAGDAEGGVGEASELCLNDHQAVCYPINTMAALRPESSEQNRQTFGIGKDGDPIPTLSAAHHHAVCYSLQGNMIGRADHNGPQGSGVNEDVSFTLNTVDRHAVCTVAKREDRTLYENHGQDSRYTGPLDVCPTMVQAWGTGGNNIPLVIEPEQKYIVRRLTPLECERLQGFPDGWTATDVNGKTVSNTQRYKALGNSFAMPNAYFFISRVIRELRKGKP